MLDLTLSCDSIWIDRRQSEHGAFAWTWIKFVKNGREIFRLTVSADFNKRPALDLPDAFPKQKKVKYKPYDFSPRATIDGCARVVEQTTTINGDFCRYLDGKSKGGDYLFRVFVIGHGYSSKNLPIIVES